VFHIANLLAFCRFCSEQATEIAMLQIFLQNYGHKNKLAILKNGYYK